MAFEQMGALATGWLSLFCLAASMFGSVSALGAAWAARWFVRRPASLTPMRWPDVSILKPLSGIEARLSENIETYFNQDYPGDIQFVFGVQDPDDGAIPVIEALMRRYPQLDLQLVVKSANPVQHQEGHADRRRQAVHQGLPRPRHRHPRHVHHGPARRDAGDDQGDDRLRQGSQPAYAPSLARRAPYPGTHLYKQALENGWLDDANAELVDDNGVQMAPLHYPGLSHTETFDSVETFYRSFYLRPAKIASIVGEMVRSPDMMKRRLREGAEFFRFLRERRATAH